MNWELVKDLPDHMIAVYYVDGKQIHSLHGKIRQLVKPQGYSYVDDNYEFVRLTSTNVPAECFTREELIFFVKDQP